MFRAEMQFPLNQHLITFAAELGIYHVNIYKDDFYALAFKPFRLKLGEKRRVKVELKGVAEEMKRVA